MEFLTGGIDPDLLAEHSLKESKYSEFYCAICINIVWDYQLCEKCEAGFCNSCITNWQKKSKNCPNCIKEFSGKKSRLFEKHLNELQLKCIYNKNGCKSIISYKNFSDHKNACTFKNKQVQLIRCKSCQEQIFDYDINYHENNECEAFKITCQFCKKRFHSSKKAEHSKDIECLQIQIIIKEQENDHILKKQKELQQSSISKGKSLMYKSTIEGSIKEIIKPQEQVSIIIIGDCSVGKTSLINRYVSDDFTQTVLTVSCDIKSKVINLLNGQVIKVTFYDTAGAEQYKSVTRSYYRSKDAAILAYDVTSQVSFFNLKQWLEELTEEAPQDITKIVVGTKCDINPNEKQVSSKEGKKFAKEHQMLFAEVSSKTGTNVANSIESLISEIFEKKRKSVGLMKNNLKLSIQRQSGSIQNKNTTQLNNQQQFSRKIVLKKPSSQQQSQSNSGSVQNRGSNLSGSDQNQRACQC